MQGKVCDKIIQKQLSKNDENNIQKNVKEQELKIKNIIKFSLLTCTNYWYRKFSQFFSEENPSTYSYWINCTYARRQEKKEKTENWKRCGAFQTFQI